MFKKRISDTQTTDYSNIDNPVSDLDSNSGNPDAWVKPEMLKRFSERNFGEADNPFQTYE